MNQKAQLGFALVLLGLGGFFVYRWMNAPSSGTQNMAMTISWICKNPDCGLDFEMTRAEVAKNRVPGTSVVACPHCESIKTARGHKCLSCGKNNQTVGHGDAPETCPQCGNPTAGP